MVSIKYRRGSAIIKETNHREIIHLGIYCRLFDTKTGIHHMVKGHVDASGQGGGDELQCF